jgi:signal transduction histidine kinase
MMNSLQARLLLAVGALALSGVVAVAVVARQGARQEFFRFRSTERGAPGDVTPGLAGRIAGELDGRCCAPNVLDAAAARAGARTAILVTEPASGRLIASSGRPLGAYGRVATHREGQAIVFEAGSAASAGAREIVLTLSVGGEALRLQDGTPAVLYLLPLPNEEGDRDAAAFLGSLDRLLLVATAVVGLAALAGTWVLARGVVRPIRRLGQATAALARGDLSVRVDPEGSREAAELGRAFNAMAAELGRQHALRQALMHDVAHELRTPLTAMRCRLETVIDGLAPDPQGAVRDLHEEVLHLGRLVDDLQDLALAEARELRLDVEAVNVRALVESAVRAARLDTDSRLQVDVDGALVARADTLRMRQVVLNLLTNADRHTPADGSIRVRGSSEDTGSRVLIEVRNTGSRLDPAERSRVFDRFYRADPSRARGTGGTGLGLAIVRHLVEAQGGSVWVESDDAGVTFGVELPGA